MPEGVLSGTRINSYKPHNCEVDIILYPLSAEIKLEYGEAQCLAHSAGKGKTRISRLRCLTPGPESSTTLSIWQKSLAHSQLHLESLTSQLLSNVERPSSNC